MRSYVRWFGGSWPAVALGLCGCTGVLGDESPSSSPTPGAGGSTMGTAGATGQSGGTSDCSQPTAPVMNARLLTPSQYEHTVQDMVGVADHPARDFGGGVTAKLDEVEVERRANAAADIAAKAVATLNAWSPCAPPAVEASVCGGQLVDKLGAAAFRHPLNDTERAQLRQLFDAGLAEKDFATGVEWLLSGLLQTPDFLYQLVKPDATEVAGQIVPLKPYELASRLALFVWDTAPDEALRTAAEQGKLADEAGLTAELTRLFADPRFGRGTSSFYSRWLGLEGFAEVARDDPGLTSEVLDAAQTSLLMSATELYKAAAPTLQSLLSGQSYYLNDKLRAFYGLAAGGPEFAAVEMPNEQRRGILTHPALLTLLARPDHGDPIARGLFLQRTVLCFDVPPPPQGIEIPMLPPIMAGLSTRARLTQHTTEPLCASCHQHIDPPGFALESYDQVGRFRTMDHGVPVDTSGNMASGGDYDGAFATGGELLDRFAQSSDVKACFAQKYMSFALSRELAAEDACSMSRVSGDFAQAGDLKQLIVSIAKSDAFRLRKSEGAAP
jgi:hypothetical protein